MRNWMVITAIFFPILVFGQDANYSQFFANRMQQNPAFAGENKGKYTVGALHRSQWSSVSTPYQASSFYGHTGLQFDPKKSNYFGAGVYVVSDQAGDSELTLLNAAAIGSYHLKMDRHNTFMSGIRIGYNQRSIDFNNLAWDSQYNGVSYDPSLPTNESFSEQSQKNIDASVGIVWRHEKNVAYEIGYAVSHYFQDQSFLQNGKDQLIMKQNLSGRFFYKWNNYDFDGYFNMAKQGGASEYMVGVIASYRYGMDSRITTNLASSALMGGVFYRYGDAIVPVVGYEFQRMLRAYISYDINISSLREVSNLRGAWEIGIQYLGLINDTRRKIK